MGTSIEKRASSRTPAKGRVKVPGRAGRPLTAAEATALGVDPPVQVEPATISSLQERRRRRRAHVPPMYTSVVVRVLARRDEPLEGHVLDVSETGMALEVDSLVPVGQAVTVEFRIAGLGRVKDYEWPEYAVAAEVVRHDNVEEFPAGPYKLALRFRRVSTMAQAQIARFVATKSS